MRHGRSDELRWWSLDPRPGETLRRAVERMIRDAIVGGALRAGSELPGSRWLASELGVSRGVVSDAYAQLTEQGFLITRRRCAPVIAPGRGGRVVSAAPRAVDGSVAHMRYDLSPLVPDIRLFPLGRWLASGRRATQHVSAEVLGFREHRGERELREVLADHLGRTRGVIAEPEQVVVTQGSGHSIDLLLRVLRGRGVARVALEDPSHVTQRAQVLAAGMSVSAQPVDEEGIIVEGLEPGAVICTPAHQFPTGVVLSSRRRRELLEWSRATGSFVIEDDYDAEFGSDQGRLRSLQGVAPDRVIHIASVSQTLAPALRLGWMVVPTALLDDVDRHRRLSDGFSPPLDQLALAHFVSSGHHARHVRSTRAIYHARRDLVLQALTDQLPDLGVSGVQAGMHVVLSLPTELDDSVIADRLRFQRVQVPPLSPLCIERADLSGLIIGYGCLHEAAIPRVVQRIATTLRDDAEDDASGRDWLAVAGL